MPHLIPENTENATFPAVHGKGIAETVKDIRVPLGNQLHLAAHRRIALIAAVCDRPNRVAGRMTVDGDKIHPVRVRHSLRLG